MDSYSEVKPAPKDFFEYKTLTPGVCLEAENAAKKLKAAKVFHINSTAVGGGVAELLKSQVPLERSLGLDSRWFVLNAEPSFFEITKRIHNLLQGNSSQPLSDWEKKRYLAATEKFSVAFARLAAQAKPEVFVIHDPQPLALVDYLPKPPQTVLRVHLDLSTPEKPALEFLKPRILKYDRVVVTHPSYRPSWLPKQKVKVITPAIDPFAEKNRPLSSAKETLAFLGVHPERPIISQVSRFDKWKDPLGVIRAYYLAKNQIPDLQLILAGAKASDDPESTELLKAVKKHARGDPAIFFYTEQNDRFINAIQTASDVVFQKSIREGFGLTVTEAMWKGKAVIGGKTAGISLQIKDGENGFLAPSPEQAARVLVRLIKDGPLRLRLGARARKTVQGKFLLSRLVLDHLKLYKGLTRP